MKHDPADLEIDALLRQAPPAAAPPAGMELRIRRALREPRPSRPALRWAWLAVPPALAAAALLLRGPVPVPPAVTAAPPPVEIPAALPDTAAGLLAAEPLAAESLALASDVKRAGHFLIDCLPAAP